MRIESVDITAVDNRSLNDFDLSAVPVKKELSLNAKMFQEFCSDSTNSHNCANCPANIGCSDWEGNRPCGQQNCWVDL